MGKAGLFLLVATVVVAMFAGIGKESQYVFKPEEMKRIAQEVRLRSLWGYKRERVENSD